MAFVDQATVMRRRLNQKILKTRSGTEQGAWDTGS